MADYTERNQRVEMGHLPERIGYRLRRAQIAVFQDLFRELAEFSITPAEYSVLTLLAHNDAPRAGQIAEALGVKPANFVRLQEKLEGRGLITRQRAPDDGRAVALGLTDAGRTLLGRLDDAISRHDARVSSRLSGDDRATLMRLLAALAA